jgi:hypothetical protein
MIFFHQATHWSYAPHEVQKRIWTKPKHTEDFWNNEMNLFVRDKFSTNKKMLSVFIDSHFDQKSNFERSLFTQNSKLLLNFLSNTTENYEFKDIDAVLTEVGSLKANVSKLSKDISELDLILKNETGKNLELKQLRRRFKVYEDEFRFALVDLIAAACGGILGTGNKTILI